MTMFKTNMIITQNYYSLTLIVSCMKLKSKTFIGILVRTKKYLILVIIQQLLFKSKLYDGSNKVVVLKMKEHIAGVASKQFVGLKPKIYSFLVDDSSEHKKEKGVKKHFVATIRHGKYKDVLLKEKCFRHSMKKFKVKIK